MRLRLRSFERRGVKNPSNTGDVELVFTATGFDLVTGDTTMKSLGPKDVLQVSYRVKPDIVTVFGALWFDFVAEFASGGDLRVFLERVRSMDVTVLRPPTKQPPPVHLSLKSTYSTPRMSKTRPLDDDTPLAQASKRRKMATPAVRFEKSPLPVFDTPIERIPLRESIFSLVELRTPVKYEIDNLSDGTGSTTSTLKQGLNEDSIVSDDDMSVSSATSSGKNVDLHLTSPASVHKERAPDDPLRFPPWGSEKDKVNWDHYYSDRPDLIVRVSEIDKEISKVVELGYGTRDLFEKMFKDGFVQGFALEARQKHLGPHDAECFVKSGGSRKVYVYSSARKRALLEQRGQDLTGVYIASQLLKMQRYNRLFEYIFGNNSISIEKLLLTLDLLDPNYHELLDIRSRVIYNTSAKALLHIKNEKIELLNMEMSTLAGVLNKVYSLLRESIQDERPTTKNSRYHLSVTYEDHSYLSYFCGDAAGSDLVRLAAVADVMKRIGIPCSMETACIFFDRKGIFYRARFDKKLITVSGGVREPNKEKLESSVAKLVTTLYTEAEMGSFARLRGGIYFEISGYLGIDVIDTMDYSEYQKNVCANYNIDADAYKLMYTLCRLVDRSSEDQNINNRTRDLIAKLSTAKFRDLVPLLLPFFKTGNKSLKKIYQVLGEKVSRKASFFHFNELGDECKMIRSKDFIPGSIMRSKRNGLVVVLFVYAGPIGSKCCCYTTSGSLVGIMVDELTVVPISDAEKLKFAEFDDIGKYFERFMGDRLVPNRMFTKYLADSTR